MNDGLCQSCKHFRRDDDGQPDGWCQRIKLSADTTPVDEGSARVWFDADAGQDEEGTGTGLVVSPTFGCTLWEAS